MKRSACALCLASMVLCAQAVYAGQGPDPMPAGGVIRGGTGLPYAAGKATRSAASTGARFAGTMATGAGAMARGAYMGVRTAAYRLAALRGRS